MQNTNGVPENVLYTASSLPKCLTCVQKSRRLFLGQEGYLAQSCSRFAAGGMKTFMGMLDKRYEGKTFLLKDITIADLAVLCLVAMIACGDWDYVPDRHAIWKHQA